MPFLAEKSRKKVKIIGKKEELLKYFDADQLLPEYGGTNPFEYRWPPDGEPVKDDPTSLGNDDNEIEDPELKNLADEAAKDFDVKE